MTDEQRFAKIEEDVTHERVSGRWDDRPRLSDDRQWLVHYVRRLQTDLSRETLKSAAEIRRLSVVNKALCDRITALETKLAHAERTASDVSEPEEAEAPTLGFAGECAVPFADRHVESAKGVAAQKVERQPEGGTVSLKGSFSNVGWTWASVGPSAVISLDPRPRPSVWRTMLEHLPSDEADRKVLEMGRRILTLLSSGGTLKISEASKGIWASYKTDPTDRTRVLASSTPFDAIERLVKAVDSSNRFHETFRDGRARLVARDGEVLAELPLAKDQPLPEVIAWHGRTFASARVGEGDYVETIVHHAAG